MDLPARHVHLPYEIVDMVVKYAVAYDGAIGPQQHEDLLRNRLIPLMQVIPSSWRVGIMKAYYNLNTFQLQTPGFEGLRKPGYYDLGVPRFATQVRNLNFVVNIGHYGFFDVADIRGLATYGYTPMSCLVKLNDNPTVQNEILMIERLKIERPILDFDEGTRWQGQFPAIRNLKIVFKFTQPEPDGIHYFACLSDAATMLESIAESITIPIRPQSLQIEIAEPHSSVGCSCVERLTPVIGRLMGL